MSRNSSPHVLHPGPTSFYGWRIAWTLALTQTIGYGVLYYAFSVFIKPMEAELGWNRTETSLGFSLALLVAGVLAIPVGRWVDRHGARGLMTFGSLLGSLVVLAWGFVEHRGVFWLLCGGLGVASSMVQYPVAFTVLAVWFKRYRSKAMLIVTLAAGLASTIFIPLCTGLMYSLGWREALRVLALILAVGTIPAHFLVIRRCPQDLGLAPDGEAITAQTEGESSSLTHRQALSTPTFWWLALAFSLSSLVALAVAAHMVPLLTERGYPTGLAAAAAGSVGLWQLVGRIVYTPLSERLSLFALSAGFSALHGAGILCLLGLPGALGLWGFAALFGLGNGSMSLAKAALVAEMYGSAHYGSINGNLTLFTAFTSMLAPLGAGLLHDYAGGYAPALWILAAASLGSALAIHRAGRHPIAAEATA
ncbi:MAG: MFS transporter [Meiothermus silvanus]|nr:MFS transporter [Allomeiothermus silvanus]